MAKQQDDSSNELTVNKSLDIKLSLNDMVDLAISEEEARLEDNVDLTNKNLNEASKVLADFRQRCTDQVLVQFKASKEGKLFTEMAAAFGINNKDIKISNIQSAQGSKKNKVDLKYKRIDEQYRHNNPNGIDRYIYENSVTGFIADHVNFKVEVEGDHDQYLCVKTSGKLSARDFTKLSAESEAAIKAVAVAHRNVFSAKVEYFKFMKNTKRMKAQVVKAALSKSKQGREMLGMLSKATNVKLLS